MLIKGLSIVILNDRQDQIFHEVLFNAAIAQELIVFEQNINNDWLKLEKKLKKINPQLKLRLIFRKYPIKDFADLRNKAIKMVRTPWLMFLDSDEILSSKNLTKLPNLLENKKVAAYKIKRLDFFHGQKLRFGEAGNYQPIRLARSNKIKYQRSIHEIALINGRIKRSSLLIKHLAHQNLEEFFKTVDRYAQLEASYRLSKKQKQSKLALYLQFFFYPPAKFLVNYLFKLGFFDGFAGLSYAIVMSFHSLLVRIYLYEKHFIN
jgi:hypothetical protein